jgi:spore maturation protein CgeB
MKLVIFGLTVSSSWGNGHATLWRGLIRALSRRNHAVVFFEKDVPYYAAHRDLWKLPGEGSLELYQDWEDVLPLARRHLADADAVIVTSYCADALAASALALDSRVGVRVFYDLDSPVTLERLAAGERVEYVGPRGLRDFDLVLTYAGGPALTQLKEKLGAQRVAPLYGGVDPELHCPAQPDDRFRAALSYLGTHSPDRVPVLRELFVEPARELPDRRFVIGGSKYGDDFPWLPNIFFLSHIPCSDHPAFFASATLSLNVTRRAMALNGFCPSGRLFEAAACGAAVLSDAWEGLDSFFTPGSEILVARNKDEVLAALERSPQEIAAIGSAARARALACHSADARARELEAILESAASPAAAA